MKERSWRIRNRRRGELIANSKTSGLAFWERLELDELQREARRRADLIAPLPAPDPFGQLMGEADALIEQQLIEEDHEKTR